MIGTFTHITTIRRFGKFFLSLFIIVSFITAPVYIAREGVRIQQAEAVYSVQDAALLAVNKLIHLASLATQAATGFIASATGALVTKEYILDTIIWPLVNVVLEGILQSTINWVNSGFDGKPMYITNLGAFFRDVADYIAEDFLLEHLDFLCSPYALDIKLALYFSYLNRYRDYEVQCRLSDAIDNLEWYLSGDFINNGGWNTWYEVALTPSNNIYGSLLEANHALYARINSANRNFSDMLDRSNNFLDLKKCDDSGKNCETITPGTAISNQLNKALSIPQDRLTVADEFDELISALLAQLVGTVLNPSGGGVRGLGASTGPNGSYFDNLKGAPKPYVYYPPIQPYTASTTLPIPGSPSQTPSPSPTPGSNGSATIDATDCTGTDAGCTSTYTWTSAGVSNLRILINGYQQSDINTPSGSKNVYLLPDGIQRFEIYDGSTLLDTDTITVTCPAGRTWDKSADLCLFPTNTLATPSNFRVVPGSCGTTDMTVSWNPITGTGPNSPIYLVYINGTRTLVTPQTSFTLNNFSTSGIITPGSTHTFTLRAADSNGQSAVSSPVTATAPSSCR